MYFTRHLPTCLTLIFSISLYYQSSSEIFAVLKLKTEECGKGVVGRVMNEWNAMVDDIGEDLNRIETAQRKTNEEVKEKLHGIERMVADLYDDRRTPKRSYATEDDVKDNPKNPKSKESKKTDEVLKKLPWCGDFKAKKRNYVANL